MPETSIQWLWFLFFGLGSLGGLAHLISLGLEVVRAARYARRLTRPQ